LFSARSEGVAVRPAAHIPIARRCFIDMRGSKPGSPANAMPFLY
jgi:hypothetical protein